MPRAVPKEKVLIVEDDRDFSRALGLRLQANGFDTVYAEDAWAAVTVAEDQRPDLVLLDLTLPVGSGFTVMDRLQNSSLAGIPVIVITGGDPQLNRDMAFALGVRAFLQKPVDNDELMAAISAALPSRADEGGGRTGTEEKA